MLPLVFLISVVAPLASITRLLGIVYYYMFSNRRIRNIYWNTVGQHFNKIQADHEISVRDDDKSVQYDTMMEKMFPARFKPPVFITFLSTVDHNGVHYYNLQSDLQLVLPWMIAFFVLVVLPTTIMAMNILRSDNQLYEYPGELRVGEALRWRKRQMKKLLKDLSINSMEVQSENILKILPDAQAESDTVLKIPKAGQIHQCRDSSDLRIVTTSCAICLSSYQLGDLIVWSSNFECPHVFHLECMTTWTKKQLSTLCPCCRQEYVFAIPVETK